MKLKDLVTVPLARKSQLLRRLTALEKENESLRERLASAQGAKTVAEEQAGKLRAEKDRLRARISAMKKASTQEARVTDQLRQKLEALQERLAELEP